MLNFLYACRHPSSFSGWFHCLRIIWFNILLLRKAISYIFTANGCCLKTGKDRPLKVYCLVKFWWSGEKVITFRKIVLIVFLLYWVGHSGKWWNRYENNKKKCIQSASHYSCVLLFLHHKVWVSASSAVLSSQVLRRNVFKARFVLLTLSPCAFFDKSLRH